MKSIHFSPSNKKGQNMIEYLLLFTAVLTVLAFAIGDNSFLSLQIGTSIDTAINAINSMASCICYEDDGDICPPVNNDGCCMPGYTQAQDNDCQPAPSWP